MSDDPHLNTCKVMSGAVVWVLESLQLSDGRWYRSVVLDLNTQSVSCVMLHAYELRHLDTRKFNR